MKKVGQIAGPASARSVSDRAIKPIAGRVVAKAAAGAGAPPHAAAAADGSRPLLQRLWEHRENYLLILPMAALVLIFSYVPMYGIVMAFKEYKMADGIFGSKWIGLLNFRKLFATSSFGTIMKNTLEISGLRLLFGFPAPVLLAILLNEVRHKPFKKTAQTISYLPHFMSWVVLGGIFKNVLSPSSGAINYVITALGGQPVNFLNSNAWFRVVLIATGVWQGIGWGSIVYLATIAGIDPQLYEAARMDGAKRFRLIWNITLPMMFPVMSVLFILSVGGILNAGFDQIFNLYNPLVYSSADILDTYVYRLGFGNASGDGRIDYSLATAVGLFKNVVGLCLVVVTNFASKRLSGSGIW
ncbi:MAG: ABC transporter permease subunit [Clostridiales bacterium]|jgi:putative aldouronate transport system permease protein|nr:ABC transporter permease subunit [Clostridiales bacterium]